MSRVQILRVLSNMLLTQSEAVRQAAGITHKSVCLIADIRFRCLCLHIPPIWSAFPVPHAEHTRQLSGLP